jgi:hypothetical protein
MFSAQKHEMPSDIPPETSRRPTDTGFGKVLNSIQGLQQRLDDFSIDEVTRAHSQAQELIRGFGLLQAQLNALTKLKDAVVSARNKIAALPEENFDLVGPDSFERHPQLRAIVKAAKLIRMHRILQAARASADCISLENSAVSGIDLPKQISATSERSPVVPPADNVVAPTVDGATKSNIASDKAEADFTSAHEDQSLPPATLSAAQQSESRPQYEFAELKLNEAQDIPLAGQKDSSEAAMADKHLPIPRNDKKPSEKSCFNERLLSDVIQTYGEFALVPISSIPPESAQSRLPAPRTATDLIPVQSAVESAFAQSKGAASLAAPAMAPEKKQAIVNKGANPSAKSRGEIDRELKNIIKDYGEYDLYSHQKSLNIKTAVIIALAVLALIVGGFYFFKTAPAPAPVASEDVLSSGRATQEIETPRVTQKLNETK